MTPDLSQRAKGVMGPIDGPVHWQPTRYVQSTIPIYLQNLNFFNVENEVVFHYLTLFCKFAPLPPPSSLFFNPIENTVSLVYRVM